MIKILLLFLVMTSVNSINSKFTYVNKEINIFKEIPTNIINEEKTTPVLATYHGPITAYGPDCTGCKTGKTASGYNVLNGNIYYNDKEYGKIRILAADKELPFGTIVRISDLDVFNEPIIAIVLDRGSAIGFKKRVYFDLLYENEKKTLFFGKRNATFEILRKGF